MEAAFLGLGVMGSAMAMNLHKAGLLQTVWNRSPEKSQAFSLPGVVPAASPSEAAQAADVLCLCVTNEKAEEEILFGRDGVTAAAKNGSLVISFSTIAPRAAQDIARRLSALGVEYLDAPVSGGDVGAREATLSIMVGGSPEAVTRAQPIFAAVGRRVVRVGESGAGQLMKCANQIAGGLGVLAMTESLFFAEKAGVPWRTAVEIISAGAASSWSFEHYGPRLIKGDFQPGFYARDMLKDLRYALAEAQALGCELPGLALLERIFDRYVRGVGGELGNHALIRVYEEEQNS